MVLVVPLKCGCIVGFRSTKAVLGIKRRKERRAKGFLSAQDVFLLKDPLVKAQSCPNVRPSRVETPGKPPPSPPPPQRRGAVVLRGFSVFWKPIWKIRGSPSEHTQQWKVVIGGS